LYLPEIILEGAYTDLGLINGDRTLVGSAEGTKFYSTGINLKGSGSNLDSLIVESGIVHLYVNGNVLFDNHSEIMMKNNAKLFIYVMKRDVNPQWTVTYKGEGSLQEVFIYAPYSNVVFQNAGAGSLYGGIVGKDVTFHNQLTITQDPNLAGHFNPGGQVTQNTFDYTAYTWVK
ncbi:MAG TPA: hypothetical protein DCS67_07535, partial [Clostridiales bacterium UBA8960]|nr:hypothetical protein [Clostridiales bacterium UBA8960]